MRTNRLAVLTLTLAALATGCGAKSTGSDGGGGGGGSDDGGNNFVAHCTVDPTRALGGACLFDDSCPCGAHCQLGTCVASCATDSDCGKSAHCDGFGRCSSSAQAFSLTVDATPQGSLGMTGVPVGLDSTHLTGTVILTATGAGVDGATVRAGAGLLLRCGADAGVETSCAVPSLAKDQRFALVVQMADTTTASTADVQVVTRREALSFQVRFTPPAGPPPALEGTYRGFAHPVAFGSFARASTSPPPDTLAEVSIPVTLTVYPESGNRRVVTLSDSLGLIFPESPTIGEILRATNGSLQLDHPARPFSGVGAGGASDVDVAVSASSISLTRGSAGLSFTLKSRYLGVIDGPSDPYVTWAVSLTRQSDLPDAGVAPTMPAPYAFADPTARANAAPAAEVAANAQLTPAFGSLNAPGALAQAVICTPYGAASAQQLGGSFTSNSRDLVCAGPSGDQPELTFGLLKDSTWQLVPTLTKCIGDLKAGQDVEQGHAAPTASAGCIDVPRAITAIDTALEHDRRRALGETVPVDTLGSALGHRLVQQWLRTHLFFAKQATQVDLLNDVLANEAQINSGFKQIDMLGLVGRGFDLLLTPRVAMALTRLPPDVLYTPDYRKAVAPNLGLDNNPRDEQPIGLPVTMVDSVQEGLKVYGTLYDRARYVPADGPALEASARDFLRKSLVVMSLAAMMNDNARANNVGTPSWDNLWQQKRGQYGIALAGLMRAFADLHAGKNPLGIDDGLDLPLYRVGDQVGDVGRFSAISDYLLGTGLSVTAIVPARVAAAQTALNAARAAWSANVTQDYAQQQSDAASQARQEAIKRRYGEKVASLCGDPNLNAATVLDANVDPDTCFVKPECRVSPAALRATLAPGDVARVLCLSELSRETVGETALSLGFTAAQLQPLLTGQVTVRGQTEANGVITVTFSDGTTLAVPSSVFTVTLSTPKSGQLTQAQLDSMTSRCDTVRGASEFARPDRVFDNCTFNGDCPGSFACVAGHCAAQSDTATQAACYTGSIGSKIVALRAASTDIEIAKSEIDELNQKYSTKMEACNLEHLTADKIEQATSDLNDELKKLSAVKLGAEVTAKAAKATSECAEAYGEDNKFGIAAGISCGADVVEAAAESVSAGMDFAMEEAQRNHEANVKKLENETAWTNCTSEAALELVGVAGANLRIKQAMQEVAHQLVEIDNLKVDLHAALVEGKEALGSEVARTVPPIGLEFWLNDAVEAYGTTFRTARRVAYLAVLAVEYEYQLSTIEKQNVLAATKVSDLQGVLDRLRNLTATGTLQGRAPSNLHSVVSLKGNLLSLADQSQLGAGFQTLTDTQRFQLLMTSSRFASYGADGTYLGQEIPFRVAPLSTLQLGDPGGVAILSGGDCAERLWSVNASLVGPAGFSVGDSTLTRVTLKKRNRFFSQWCGTPPVNAPKFQVSATRPSRNLFLDPYSDYIPGGGATPDTGTVTDTAEADSYTSARLQPVLNVSRADFESAQFFNGSSQELAGRSLYGDYTLFIPAEFLSKSGGNGLVLGQINDVLLRFDYVSVAK